MGEVVRLDRASRDCVCRRPRLSTTDRGSTRGCGLRQAIDAIPGGDFYSLPVCSLGVGTHGCGASDGCSLAWFTLLGIVHVVRRGI